MSSEVWTVGAGLLPIVSRVQQENAAAGAWLEERACLTLRAPCFAGIRIRGQELKAVRRFFDMTSPAKRM